ncbi:hypothetical protein BaRGS_00028887 [Batillaria attramentaria]|uniref:Uncharacterized protein n=1 Tax=Batillaria attramentaria TaxID=370345 RepID=A0ABD0JYU9_9CAEN
MSNHVLLTDCVRRRKIDEALHAEAYTDSKVLGASSVKTVSPPHAWNTTAGTPCLVLTDGCGSWLIVALSTSPRVANIAPSTLNTDALCTAASHSSPPRIWLCMCAILTP